MSLKVLKQLHGKRIGKVTVLHPSTNNRIVVVRTGEEYRPRVAWVCQCDCGHTWDVPQYRITNTTPSSCNSCADRTHKLKLPRSEHIKRGHPSYNSWYAMIRRCTSNKHENYHNYGGRGIVVCSRWLSFDAFVEDMGIRPEGHTIDRIDNDKGYYKENCKWSTPKEQRQNTRPAQKRSKK